jgi:hypothetical protein
MSRIDLYRSQLQPLKDWVPFLKQNSGLPGSRGNLELALPDTGKPIMEKWSNSADKDILWMMRENLKKNRLVKMDGDWVKRCLTKFEK